MRTISEALLSLRPGASWALSNGDDLSTLRWDDLVQIRPTDAEIQARMTAGPTQNDLAAYAASKRYTVEIGGFTSSMFGRLWTDRETQSMLSRGTQLLDKGMLTAPLKIKTPNGFVLLDKLSFEAIGAAVAGHVQAAFDVEGDVGAAILAGTITTTAQIDAAAWPSNA